MKETKQYHVAVSVYGTLTKKRQYCIWHLYVMSGITIALQRKNK